MKDFFFFFLFLHKRNLWSCRNYCGIPCCNFLLLGRLPFAAAHRRWGKRQHGTSSAERGQAGRDHRSWEPFHALFWMVTVCIRNQMFTYSISHYLYQCRMTPQGPRFSNKERASSHEGELVDGDLEGCGDGRGAGPLCSPVSWEPWGRRGAHSFHLLLWLRTIIPQVPTVLEGGPRETWWLLARFIFLCLSVWVSVYVSPSGRKDG